MVPLAREIVRLIIEEYSPCEVLRRLSDPFWFQAFGCVLGFDWHSSGLTTTTTGALKLALKEAGREWGLFVAGGKGRTSRSTPLEIENVAESTGFDPKPLVRASRLSAKVDSSALQDGYQVYHHCFIFTPEGKWAVVQQGMNEETGYARRYHWLALDSIDFVNEPHSGIATQKRGWALNLVAGESEQARKISAELANERPEKLVKQIRRLKGFKLPRRHYVLLQDIDERRLEGIFLRTYERAPKDFVELLGIKGVGAKTLRALALVAELIYGAELSFRDPARFSFAHGGKDGHPYPVDRELYDGTIAFLEGVVSKAKVDESDRKRALKRLAHWRKNEVFGVS